MAAFTHHELGTVARHAHDLGVYAQCDMQDAGAARRGWQSRARFQPGLLPARNVRYTACSTGPL